MSKGQSELMGFAIVILLISVGLLLILGYLVFKPNDAYARSFDRQVAVYLNQAIYHTSTPCNNLKISDLIALAAEDDANKLCPGSMTAREYLNVSMESILNRTVDTWGFQYEYKLLLLNPDGVQKTTLYEKHNLSKSGCNERIPSTTQLPRMSLGSPQVQLDVCV